jgi:hypothetical protein
LRGSPLGIEGEEIIFPDTVVVTEEFETGFEDAGFGVLVGDTEHDYCSSVLVIEINSF